MRRSICVSEPNFALAGQVNTWHFVYQPAVSLPKGTRLKFDLLSQGRAIDWELPESSGRATGNGISAEMPGSKALAPKELNSTESVTPQYEFVLPSKLEAGKPFTVVMGDHTKSRATKKPTGNTAQVYVQRRRPFLLYVDPTGKGHYGEPEVFSIDIRGNELDTIKILAPSFVGKNRRFDVTVRFEDAFGNLTANTDPSTLIELSYENLRDSLNWKLFVPETGFITLPNLYFNEEGVYTITLKNLSTGDVYRSSPIRCFTEIDRGLFWGVLHGESERIDSTENIEGCLRHIRDDKSLQFFGTSSFESQQETPNEVWKLISQNVADFDEEDRFTTFLGFQWAGASGAEGVRHIVYSKDTKPLLRKKDSKSSSLSKIYRMSNPGELISIPSFTMGKGYSFDFKSFNAEFEPVVEIYNAWGSSECSKKEGNPLPIGCEGRKGVKEDPEGSIRKALSENHRFGFIAGGLDDRGLYNDFFESDQFQYPPGLTAIMSGEQSRDTLIEALRQRRCYATTGERIIIGLNLAGAGIGSELNTEDKPGLAVNRHLHGFIAGTSSLSSVEIIRNGKVLKSWSSDTYHLDFEYDDMEAPEKITFKGGAKKPPFVYYYLRVIQSDGHMAWSSPIWVDFR